MDSVFCFSHTGLAGRARLFRRRAGCRDEKMPAVGENVVKDFWKGRDRGER